MSAQTRAPTVSADTNPGLSRDPSDEFRRDPLALKLIATGLARSAWTVSGGPWHYLDAEAKDEGEGRMATDDNVAIITEFIDAWSRLDPDELSSYFADDGCYHNMPAGPVSGRDNVRDMIAAFTAGWTGTEWEILNIVGEGNVVIAERLDKTMAGDKSVDLPCTGVFEMDNGKIKVWRDYFDLGTYINAMS